VRHDILHGLPESFVERGMPVANHLVEVSRIVPIKQAATAPTASLTVANA
jgi:hypothetical protein